LFGSFSRNETFLLPLVESGEARSIRDFLGLPRDFEDLKEAEVVGLRDIAALAVCLNSKGSMI
jgi:hypothetical protein